MNDIRSNKRCYPVGQRGKYVYFLVQDLLDLAKRESKVQRLIAEYGLTEDEQIDLASRLAALDQRRQQAAARSKKPVDPYWRLWGQLKARYHRDQDVQSQVDALQEPGISVYDEFAWMLQEKADSHRFLLVLPLRKVPVDYDGTHLMLGAMKKRIQSDTHAVNSLRKLDTDDQYFADQTGD